MTTRPRGADDRRLKPYPHEVITHRPAASLEEAARMRGLESSAIVKTMVIRRADGDYLFVLVPGDRVIDWPKMRTHLGERRLSMADRDQAFEATGYWPGTITPLGAIRDWPVLADVRLSSRLLSIGAGERGWSITVGGPDLIELLSAEIADLTKPAKG